VNVFSTSGTGDTSWHLLFGVSPDDSVTTSSLGKSGKSGSFLGASVIRPRWAIIVGVRTVGSSSSSVLSRISSDSESKSGGFGGSIIVPVETSNIFKDERKQSGNSPGYKRRSEED
jgi:hypothetical protein